MRVAVCRTLLVVALLVGGTLPAVAQDAPKPGKFTLADFRGLRFVEGSWKGSGYAPGPFYETYRFINDSTIEMSAWSDSTFARRDGEVSLYVFRGGEIRSRDGRAAVTHIDSLGYHFHTMTGQPHRWTFRRISADRWTATLGTRPTVYTMDRVKR